MSIDWYTHTHIHTHTYTYTYTPSIYAVCSFTGSQFHIAGSENH